MASQIGSTVKMSNAITSPVIFLPGTLCDERIFFPLWQQMNLQNRAYVPLQWADSLEQMLALTQDRINSFEQPVHLVGFSMGAYIASLAAINKSNESAIASITCIGYNPNGLSDAENKARMGMLKTLRKKQSVNLGQARLAQYFTASELQQRDYIQPILDMEADLGTNVLHAHISATTPRTNLVAKLNELQIPQHWIAAEHDKIANAQAIQQYCEKNSQATYTELGNTGHITPLTKTAELSTYLQDRFVD